MAIYHLEAKVVSRSAGRSAVAASAYLSCSRLYNDYDGIQHDYTRKQGLVVANAPLGRLNANISTSSVAITLLFRLFFSITISSLSYCIKTQSKTYRSK